MSGKIYACANLAAVDLVDIWPTLAGLRHCLAGGMLVLLLCLSPTDGQPHSDRQGLPALPPEVWHLIYDGDSRVGHSVMRWQKRTLAHGDTEQVIWTQQTSLTVRRFDTVCTQQMILTSVERPDGTVDEFSSQHIDGDHTTTLRGVRDGDRIKLSIDSARPADNVVMENATSLRGQFALEQSLAAAPLRPGDQRRLLCLFPLSTTAAELTLSAGAMELTELLDGEARLLRIAGQIRWGERGWLDFDCWQDDAGRIQKMHVAASGQTTFAATREEVLSTSGQGAAELPDLGVATLVPARSVGVNPHLAEHMRYSVHAEHGTLKGMFPSSPNQAVLERMDGSLLIQTGVRAVVGLQTVDSAANLQTARGADAPDPLASQPNRWIESDDELIKRMSREVASHASDARLVARALTAHVYEWLEHKDYGRAWDSAAAVARSRRGDCTEHAVLTAALCRARGIPARIAYGLVYLNARQAFGAHAWTEVWIDGDWVGLDATREDGAVGAGHIKLGDSNLSGTTAQMAMLPLTQLLSQKVSIEVTRVEAETEK